MSDDKIEEFLDKLKPCIDKGELDACVDEAARLAEEMGISASEMLDLSTRVGMVGKYASAYVLAGAAAQGLEGRKMAEAHHNVGLAAQHFGNVEKAEEEYKLAIEIPKYATAHSNYGLLLHEKLKRLDEAEEQYKLAIEADPKLWAAHLNFGLLLHEKLNRWGEAEEQYNLAIEANPKHPNAYSNYGLLLHEKLKRLDEAEEQYKLAIEADAEYANAHYNYGNLLKELNRKEEAEEQYILAIEADPEDASNHYNYAILLEELDQKEAAEEQYKLVIKVHPKHAGAHSNYGLFLRGLGRKEEAEEQYILAIEADPKLAAAHSNYGNLLKELKKNEDAEEQYILAIEADPEDASNHYNYAILLEELDQKEAAEEQYKLVIKADPKHANAHSNYGLLLRKLGRKEEVEEQYILAIEADPKHANAHGAYGLLLIEKNSRKEAWEKTQKASLLFAENGDLTMSHIAKALFYERYSEKYFNQRKFRESGEDALKAGDAYLNAAETADANLKDNFSQQGNIRKAKSFMRKVPKKSWRRKILYQLGKKHDIPDIINNLKEAASYYEKASMCPVDEKQDICNACHISITVFSETLSAMDAFINKRNAEINKKEWDKSLESARLIYEEKEMKNGVALVDTLKQLIKCVDEMAVHRENGLEIQKDKCGKCFGKLADVSENLDGALNVLAEHSIEAIRDYAKQQGMGGFGDYETKKSIWNNWFVRGGIFIVATILLNLVSSKLIDLNVLAIIWNFLKSLIP